jgi:hypothetical protein
MLLLGVGDSKIEKLHSMRIFIYLLKTRFIPNLIMYMYGKHSEILHLVEFNCKNFNQNIVSLLLLG